MATERTIEIDAQAKALLVGRIINEALRGVEFDLDPVDLLREAVELVNGDAMVIVNRMPEAV
jgi:hypothetical protein